MMEPDSATLATVASIIAAFGTAMIFFRIQREDSMRDQGERVWLPLADWLLIVATTVCLLAVSLPITLSFGGKFATAGAAAAVIMVAGYPFAILAHYRIIFGQFHEGPRDNPEPMERVLVIAAFLAAITVFAFRLAR